MVRYSASRRAVSSRKVTKAYIWDPSGERTVLQDFEVVKLTEISEERTEFLLELARIAFARGEFHVKLERLKLGRA